MVLPSQALMDVLLWKGAWHNKVAILETAPTHEGPALRSTRLRNPQYIIQKMQMMPP